MLKKIAFLIVVAITTVAMTAFHGHAAVARPGTTISAVAGWFVPGGGETLDTGPLIGLKAGKSLTEIMDLEGDLTLIQAGTDARAYELSLQCLYELWETPKWDGFMSIGAGGVMVEGGEGSSGILLSLGLRGKYHLRSDLALRGDLRQVIATGSIGNNIEFAMGLAYYFDSTEKKGPRQRLRRVQEPEAAPPPAEPAPEIKPAAELPAPAAAEAAVPPEPAAAEAAVAPEPAAAEAVVLPPAAEPAYETSPYAQPLSDAPVSEPAAAREAQAPVLAAVARAQGSEPPSAPAEPAKPLRVVQTIKFDAGSSSIAPKYYPKLEIVVNAMKKNPDAKAVISGHADDTGSKALNVKLSAFRADSVIYRLTKAGIDRSRLSRAVYGSSTPAASNATKAGKAQNRRAVTVVTVEVK